MKKALFAMGGVLVASVASANFTEGFDDILTLAGSGWAQQNLSSPIGTTNWFQGNDTVFPAQTNGGSFGTPPGAGSYIGTNFNNGTGTATLSNWLIAPTDTLGAGGVLTFWTRTVATPAFPDRLQVWQSTNGASANVGATATSTGDFTTLLLDINPTYLVSGTGSFPNAWTQFTINLTGANVTGRLAFRYFVENGGPGGANSDYIGIDTVNYAAPVPEPATMATLALGGLALLRRRKKA